MLRLSPEVCLIVAMGIARRKESKTRQGLPFHFQAEPGLYVGECAVCGATPV